VSQAASFSGAETLRNTSVCVKAPARLHFGLHNESGAFGRVDGGLGLALQSPRWHYHLAPADADLVDGCGSPELVESILRTLPRLRERLGAPPLGLDILEEVGVHRGLGSKTSLLMSLGSAIQSMTGLVVSRKERAALVGRGTTSGIGTMISEFGGVAVDFGHAYPAEKSYFLPSGVSSAPAPDGLAVPIPAHTWWVVLLQYGGEGLSGAAERALFEAACPVPEEETREILVRSFAQVIPSLAQGDEPGLHDGLRRLQLLGLKRFEWASQDEQTTDFRDWFDRNLQDRALCLSSMGPAMFVITTDPGSLLEDIERYRGCPPLITVTSIAAEGCRVTPAAECESC